MMTVEHLLTKTHSTYFKNGKVILCHELDEGYHFTSKKITNLCTGEIQPFCLDTFKEFLEKFNLREDYDLPIVFNFHYEVGSILELGEVPLDDIILFDYLKFTKSEELDLKPSAELIDLKIVNQISRDEYFEKFYQVNQNLLDGNCYQLNLTSVFDLSFKCPASKLYQKFLSSEKLSQYAHSIYIENFNSLILSNSPECLFEIVDNELYTRPIKGTLSDKLDLTLLIDDEKNNCELSIITDLLRNDLSRIGNSFSEVVSSKQVFRVPGLYHQYSEIKVKLDDKVNLLRVMESLFPGGSITGAPKKRVLKLINLIEKQSRGVYTGSTIILHEKIKASSINIRTAFIDIEKSNITYGAGGGITLMSKCDDEYDEMISKVQSFTSIFNC